MKTLDAWRAYQIRGLIPCDGCPLAQHIDGRTVADSDLCNAYGSGGHHKYDCASAIAKFYNEGRPELTPAASVGDDDPATAAAPEPEPQSEPIDEGDDDAFDRALAELISVFGRKTVADYCSCTAWIHLRASKGDDWHRHEAEFYISKLEALEKVALEKYEAGEVGA